MRKGIKYLVLGALLFCSIFYARKAEAASVRINKTNFPDALLREKLKYKDYNKDGKLSDKEIRKIKKIDLRAEKDGKYWKINLKGISRLTSLKNLSLVWRVWPLLLLSSASPSSTPKKLTPPTSPMKIMMATLPPIASWQKELRYSNTTPLTLVKMNLMRISSPATLNLLKLL